MAQISPSSMPEVSSAIDIQAIESNISGWTESSKVLMSALDGITATHTVVGVAVLAFKAVVTLEMKRRDNDKRVIALCLQMQAMMSVLLQLRGRDSSDDQCANGAMLRYRLEPLMIKIAQEITECGNVCDTYSKKNILVKVLKSAIYERRLADYFTTFKNRQREIHTALILHTSFAVESASSKINAVHDKASLADAKLNLMITLLFRRLDSPHESELMKFIDAKGGAEKCVVDDDALMQLAAIRTLQGSPVVVNTPPERNAAAALSGGATAGTTSSQIPQPPFPTQSLHQSNPTPYPSSFSYPPQPPLTQPHSYSFSQPPPTQPTSYPYPYPSQPPLTQPTSYYSLPQPYYRSAPAATGTQPPLATRHRLPATVRLKELKWELSEDVDVVLSKNMVVFIRKLDVQKRQLVLEMTAVVRTQLDRVIKAVDAGPHDRVVDPDFRAIWKDMAWRTSVKARTFVFAVHTHFTGQYHNADPLQAFLTSNIPKGIQDFQRVQALANKKAGDWEAVEYINMANLRPILECFDDDRSGYITIREVNSFTAAKPEYMSLPEWISYWAVGWHFILSRYKAKICHTISDMYASRKHLLPTNRALVDLYLDSFTIQRVDLIMHSLQPFATKLDDNLKNKSLRYANEEERRMEANLCLIAYEIDAPSTSALITGPGRIEKYLFTLLFLLLRHHLRIISAAAREILAREELITAINSLQLVLYLVDERVHTLRVIFRELFMWSGASAGDLFDTAFGMFAKLDQTIHYGVALENLQGSKEDQDEPYPLEGELLKHHVELDRTVYDLMPAISPAIPVDPSHSSIEGTWSGFVESDTDGHGLFQVDLHLPYARTQIRGSGLDVNGQFQVLGSVHDDGSFTVTLKRPEVAPVSDIIIPLHISGKLEPSENKIEVEWGAVPGLTVGKITLHPGPSELTRFRWNAGQSRYPWEETGRSPARIRWSFACSAILDHVRSKMWCWSFFKDRRDRRRDYTSLYRRQYLLGSLEGDNISKLATLEKTLSPLDVRFYRSICRAHYSICHHWGVFCQGCQEEIIGDRYMCICDACLFDHTGPNFCSKCVNLFDPYTTHRLLKFSRFVQNREGWDFVEAALRSHRQHHPILCRVCLSTAKPVYWCCVICHENVMVCEDCDPQRLSSINAMHDESHLCYK